MLNEQQLINILKTIDNQSYPAYKRIKGLYNFAQFNLIIDHVQGDPFASPSKIRIKVPQSVAKFPDYLYNSTSRKIALIDYLHRQIATQTHKLSQSRGSGKSGLIAIDSIGQEVLARSSVLINNDYVEVRLVVGLPARGRRVLAYQAIKILCEDLPLIVEESLVYPILNHQAINHHLETVETADFLREQLDNHNLVAFVANGAILPRRSGVDFRPLQGKDVIKFQSPTSLEVELNCPNDKKIKGMGIKKGITLIVGGGYHGKSTLLQALALGVYNQIPDDGREFVVTNPNTVKIRAEDGRSITGVNISPFINHLPQGKSTVNFSTTNASGSTSQSANIIEALEVGCQVLLIDEDTSATNFMIRDGRMQRLISKEKEPITPLIDKIKQLYEDYQVSTILVMGGSGDYFEVADTVIAMDCFQPQDVTEKAKQIAQEFSQPRDSESGVNFGTITPRIINPHSIDASKGKREVKLKVRDVEEIFLGNNEIDLTAVEQIVHPSQLRAIAYSIVYAKKKYLDNQRDLATVIDLVMEDIDKYGLDVISNSPQGDLALLRKFELASAINRLRSLVVLTK